MFFTKKPFVLTICLLFAFLLLAGNAAYAEVIQTAVVANAAADYSSGTHSVISVDPVGGPRTVRNDLLPTISDITVDAYGKHFYRIERYNADNVTKFDINAPDTPVWQFSTMGPDEKGTSNPHGLIFVSEEKAYLTRMGSKKAWIVNPSASTEAEFKIGELDLSAYADSDGNPEMHSGVIAKGKFFLCLRRLDRDNGFAPTNTAYVAIFNIESDEEMDAGTENEEGLRGIPLPIRNPGAIAYLPENDTIYVQGTGRYKSSWSGTPAEYSGGIAAIDPDTFEVRMILDDDTDGDGVPLYGGNISGMAIISPTKGYITTYASSEEGSVRTFDPSSGTVGNVVAGLEKKSISGMDSGVYPDKNGMLWISNHTDASVDILDTASDTIDESVPTNLNPQKVVFCSEIVPGDPITDQLRIRAVIHTEEEGPIEAVWHKGGEDVTEGGDRVIWGHFYAGPELVSWGSSQNPDLFVKIWFDRGGRVDVNFFHVSVPDIDVFAEYDGKAMEDTATLEKRHIRIYYNQDGEDGIEAER